MRRWTWAAVFAGGTVVFGMVALTNWRHARDASRSTDNLARAAGGLGYGFAVGAGVLAAGMLALLVWQLRSRTYGSSPDPRLRDRCARQSVARTRSRVVLVPIRADVHTSPSGRSGSGCWAGFRW